jgi:cytochrome P450
MGALYSTVHESISSAHIFDRSGWDWTLAFFTYGNKWRFYRRLFHQHFNINAVANFEPQETKAAHDLLYRLVQEPEKFMEYTKL